MHKVMKQKDDVIVVSSKGVAQDNRRSKWTKPMGLRLIVSCDKEMGEEIKLSRQNHLSQKSRKGSLTAHVTLQHQRKYLNIRYGR